ncbi:hypothetical protein ACFLYC_02210 [Chloroflexota bacterium]
MPNWLKLLEFNQTAFGYVFNLNSGLNSRCHWIGRFSQEEARNILGVTDDCHIVTILPLGFPKEPGRPKVRKSIEEIVCYEKFKK